MVKTDGNNNKGNIKKTNDKLIPFGRNLKSHKGKIQTNSWTLSIVAKFKEKQKEERRSLCRKEIHSSVKHWRHKSWNRGFGKK